MSAPVAKFIGTFGVKAFAAAAALAPIMVSGCALIIPMPPTVRVLGVQLTALGVFDQQLATTLCITNPNSTALSFRQISVAVDVSGFMLAGGEAKSPVFLAPQTSTIVPFTVTSTVRNLGEQLLGALRSGSVQYRVYGSVSLNGPFGLTIPFSRSGQLDPLGAGLGLLDAATDPVDATRDVACGAQMRSSAS